ncbi:hypothetical protein HJFPF1_04415 [Paramyrothecium foliicola]|nr:hypothetical protein HJFPF1_04415 [Paramyrothecium foliicola]
MPVPTSTSIYESVVIEAPFSNVWHLIKLQEFSKWWSKLEKSEWLKGTSDETDIIKWTFKDGTVLQVKQEEHSSIDHYVTYSVISSEPALSYTSVVSTIRVYPITSGHNEGHAYLTWSAHFSSDADAGVIEDAKFKRKEAFADLAKLVAKNHPDYSDLALKSGTFQEALANTSEAKTRYTDDDLYLRGSQLLASSYKHGVSALRAFVEIDHVTGFRPLKIAMRLKDDFAHLVEVQICAFAQDPIFSTEYGEENRSLISAALEEFEGFIDVLGTTPYVEADVQSSRRNIQWAVETALRHGKHLDFHIEYNLNGTEALNTFNYLLDTLVTNSWPTEMGAATVVLGHATSLSQASHTGLMSLAEKIHSTKLPVHFVGLPSSDLFMMGRPEARGNDEKESPFARPRGTLNVPKMINEYGFNATMAVNNVGNAFTPYGTGDPLALACWGVGVYHAGTEDEARLLYEAVSVRARDAIMPFESRKAQYPPLSEGSPMKPMLLIHNEKQWELGDPAKKTIKVPARPRRAIKDVVWDPPETSLRSIIR